jgi:HlyD family secretion protein
MRTGLTLLVGALSVILIALVVAFWPARKDQPEYFTAKVERGDVRDVVDSTGTINAVTTVLVGSQISGRIVKLSADFNSVVRKGQIIAEIDQALFQGALLQAEADLKSAEANVIAANADLDKAKAVLVQTKADYGRAAVLATQDSISMQAVDLSKANYDSAAATVAATIAAVQQAKAQVNLKAAAVTVARTNLEYTVIRSPINGTVVARNVDVGQTVAASLQAPTLFTIAQDLTKMQVYAKIDESNVGRVKVGRTATFKVDAFPKDTFKGMISQVRMNPTMVQNVVTYDVIVDFENPELQLFPGMTAYVTVPVASAENVLKIPNAALRYTPQLSKKQIEEFQQKLGTGLNDRTVVWKLLPDNTAEPVRVALGITDHSYTVLAGIVSGKLEEGDDLVTGAVPTKYQVPGGPAAGGPPKK